VYCIEGAARKENGAITGSVAPEEEAVVSWFAQAEARKRQLVEAVTQRADPWSLPLERLHGQVGDDGIERVTTQVVLDVLEVPQLKRRAGTYRRLAKLMAELGWSAVRVRGLTRGGYLEQVRGFARDTRS
jgi:hypothetical protein